MAGLLLAAWPAMTWGYGAYCQAQMSQGFSTPEGDMALGEILSHSDPIPSTAVSSTSWQPEAPSTVLKRRGTVRHSSGASATAFARLKISRIGLDAMVVEGADSAALRRGPGHLPNTGRPGETGNCAIAAHRDAWFRDLHNVRTGDSVAVETQDAVYLYRVTDRAVVRPNRTDLLNRGLAPTLTLITCTGPGYPHSTERLLVFCALRAARPL